ncbi:MAG TPA: class I SAM-dependent methyltransferase [Iamia sp.]|jgi:SAM-dependent methyltransferase|nr:class I SAM-dependent methyltransferase [Iamia sp.]
MGEGAPPTFTSGEFFVALAGLAAMRHVLVDPARARPRIDEARAVAARFDEPPNDIEIPVVEHTVATGYAAWAPSYDGPNPAIAREEPVVHGIVDALPVGRALDACCGTGRHAAHLVDRGWDVVGVDATHEMLEVARAKTPLARFEEGDVLDLPLADETVDLAVCSLALTHVPDLGAALAELARVVRPGGTVVLSDIHPVSVLVGGTAAFPHEGGLAHVRNLHHPVSHYVRAIGAAGLEIVDCVEPTHEAETLAGHLAYPFVPDAVVEAYEGLPFLLIWHLRRSS